MRQLQSEQMRVRMTTSAGRREDVEGKIIKHRALFAGVCASSSLFLLLMLLLLFLLSCKSAELPSTYNLQQGSLTPGP